VGLALKVAGYRVIANDHTTFAHTLARCYVEADADLQPRAAELVAHLGGVAASADPGPPLADHWFVRTYCEQARYLHPRNGPRIVAVRQEIARLAPEIGPLLEAVLLVSLLEAADRVDSTTGLQMAYLKSWAPRAVRDLELRTPALAPRPAGGACEAHCLDALEAARGIEADIAYIDPPYNQHSYLRNYHVWETLVRFDQPEHFGLACKRIDCRTRLSPFNSRRQIRAAMAELIASIRARALVVSFNNEGYIPRNEMEQLLESRGRVRTLEHDYKRYVGAQIGIYSPQGEKVGRVSHLRNKEYLYIVECD
jgi:adenine-specific DNA-methyltransferase